MTDEQLQTLTYSVLGEMEARMRAAGVVTTAHYDAGSPLILEALKQARDERHAVPGLSESDVAYLSAPPEGLPPLPWRVARAGQAVQAVAADGKPILHLNYADIDFTVACMNALRPLLDALLDAQRLVEVMATDGSPAYDLGRSVGRGEAVRAFDWFREVHSGLREGMPIMDTLRAYLVASGAHARLPLDDARAENERLRDALRSVLKYPAVAGTPLAGEVNEALAGGRKDG